ncbi:hypothetical protein GGI24_001176 [Coemansia furcata]|nr:hypothetical protein GGI24_001176 [Coemansia furcata]
MTEAITRKTRFVDLPADVQKLLESIEQQKQAQLQIGSAIQANETEHELQQISQRVQRLSQDLQVARMTLGGDRERVDDARAQVSFAVKHAEKGASLVAHATDDQAGVASRHRALAALQGGAAEVPEAVDAYEAVRRMQMASASYNVASDYYWAWLARVEAAAVTLTERLDQLERFAKGADGERVSPRAVADVIGYQNDSFLAIAGRVAALDDDVRRLRKKLGVKDAN